MKKYVTKSKIFKTVPKFKTEKEESLFWQNADSFEYLDWDRTEKWIFPNLKLTSAPITIRMPENLLNRVKMKAHQRDIPYQTLIKQFIYTGLEE